MNHKQTMTQEAASRQDGLRQAKWYLKGNFAPLPEEVAAVDLAVKGALPAELHGRYLRNGPNPRPGREPSHWFVGDGMLHGVRIVDGRAEWFRSRWVRTSTFETGEPFALREDGSVDRLVTAANTHVICHAGRILALYETAFPTEVTPELDTVGPHDFDGRLTTAMTAHPKRCPVTGELLFFGYDPFPPYLTYHRATATGELIQSETIDVPGAAMIHDFAITAGHVVWMDLPIVFDIDLVAQGRFPYVWSDDYGARLGVMPRTGGSADVVWFDIEPCYVFHTVNAHEDDAGVLTLDAVRYPEVWRGAPEGFEESASLWRWTIDPRRGTVSENQLDDQPCEFPRVDPRRVGLANRNAWMASTSARVSADGFGSSILKYDASTGHVEPYPLTATQSPGEPVFVPSAAGGGEDEGWVLSYVYDQASDRSELLVLDAHDWGTAPVARVQLPSRVPYGFHGTWVDDDDL
jgi:carotenoid cleavage dioxygenase-like enzyme